MNAPDAIPVYRTTYDRPALRAGVVHLGYGAFHRAHQAVYLDDYMQASGDLGWGIAAVNLRAADSAAFERAATVPQGYVVKSMAPSGRAEMRFVRSHHAFADWATDPHGAEALLASPDVHVLSMTVTESGYYLTSDWTLDTEDPVIARELAGGDAVSVYGYLRAALRRRMQAGGAPLTILCCDNIRSNGTVLEGAVLAYLNALGDRELATWVREYTRFPCSMVDRITPRASPDLTSEIEALLPGQVVDPIHAEAFRQWVIEDSFAGPMPDLSRAGVEIVADVHPYEEAKIRILNGGHTGLAYLGALAGHETFDQAMADPALRAHFDAWERDEVLPGLTLDLPFDKAAYLDEIADRFCNAAIADQLERICMDGYSKMSIYVVPTMEACMSQGIEPVAGYRCIASWYVFARRAAEGNAPLPYHEPCWSDLAPLLAPGQEEAFARAGRIWGDLPERFEGFVPGVLTALKEMDRTWPA